MTERERFEEWFNDFHIEEHPNYQTIRDFAFAGWQAALNGSGDPVAWGREYDGKLMPELYSSEKSAENATEGMNSRYPSDAYKRKIIKLYTSPPNTYTEAEVDEMMMKVATQVNVAVERYWKKKESFNIRAIVDKIKSEKG